MIPASEHSDELRQQGIQALRAGDRARARELLQQALQLAPHDEQAWLWLSGALENPAERRAALERVLAINPAHKAAARGLALLAQAGDAQAATPAAPGQDAGTSPPASPAPQLQPASERLSQPGSYAELAAAIRQGRAVERRAFMVKFVILACLAIGLVRAAPGMLAVLSGQDEVDASAAGQAYIQRVDPHLQQGGAAIRRLYSLFEQPAFRDNRWQQSVASELAIIRSEHQAVRSLAPVPPEMRQVHGTIIGAINECNQGLVQYEQLARTGDFTRLQAIRSYMSTCARMMNQAEVLVHNFLQRQ